MNVDDDDHMLFMDSYNLFLGRRLDYGATRSVFDLPLREDLVAKVETKRLHSHGDIRQNEMEWGVWNVVKMQPDYVRKWFAPCERISPDGRILIMHRTHPVERRKLPERMPAFFADFKQDNFGMLDGRIVCHDYAVSALMHEGMTKRMTRVHWK